MATEFKMSPSANFNIALSLAICFVYNTFMALIAEKMTYIYMGISELREQ